MINRKYIRLIEILAAAFLGGVFLIDAVAQSSRKATAPTPSGSLGQRSAKVTWLAINNVGRSLETVPPMVLYVDKGALQDANTYLKQPTEWSARLTSVQMKRIVQVLLREKLLDMPKAAAAEVSSPYRIVFGGGGAALTFRLDSEHARQTVLAINKEVKGTSASEPVTRFAQSYGWH